MIPLKNLINVHTYVHTGNNGDYENAQEDEDEEEEEVEEGGSGGASDVNVLRAHSMGCTAEEAWKRYALSFILSHSSLCHPFLLFSSSSSSSSSSSFFFCLCNAILKFVHLSSIVTLSNSN